MKFVEATGKQNEHMTKHSDKVLIIDVEYLSHSKNKNAPRHEKELKNHRPMELTSLQTIFNFYKAPNVEQIKHRAERERKRGRKREEKTSKKLFCFLRKQNKIKKAQNYRSKMSKI